MDFKSCPKLALKRYCLVCMLMLTALIFSDAVAMPPHPDIADVDHDGVGGYKAKTHRVLSDWGIDSPSKVFPANKASINGSFKALAVLVSFSDKGSSVNAADFDTLLFEERTATLRDYYSDMSFGQLDIISLDLPSEIGWVTAPQTYAYYCDGENGTGSYPQNSQRLCEDVVDIIDPLVDFSQYDNNGNGFVDALILIHTGPGAELFGPDSVDYIWSHKWSISPRYRDNVYIYEYTVQPEYWFTPGDMTCGVFCHELGHIFGLPDLYDRDNSSYGIGKWSVMSYGSWLGPGNLGGSPAGLDAWSRLQLGFNAYINVTSNSSGVNIASVENGGPIYRLWSSGAIGSEYYLVENRQRIGYDTYLPSDGLLVWHVDESKSASWNDDEWYPGQTLYGNYLVALEQSDGLYEMEKKLSKGNAGDPFPGNSMITSFSPATVPGSNDYDDNNTYVSISNISSPGPTMTADFQVSLLSDIEGENSNALPAIFSLGQNYPNPFNPSTTIEVNLAYRTSAILNIYDILGREIDRLMDGVYPAGEYVLEWDVRDDHNGSLSSGVYFYKLMTDYGVKTKKMTFLK